VSRLRTQKARELYEGSACERETLASGAGPEPACELERRRRSLVCSSTIGWARVCASGANCEQEWTSHRGSLHADECCTMSVLSCAGACRVAPRLTSRYGLR
jgi:hypothetical protein